MPRKEGSPLTEEKTPFKFKFKDEYQAVIETAPVIDKENNDEEIEKQNKKSLDNLNKVSKPWK